VGNQLGKTAGKVTAELRGSLAILIIKCSVKQCVLAWSSDKSRKQSSNLC